MESEFAMPTTDWEAVYWALMPRLYNFFRYRTGDDQIAEDLTSTTLMRAWKHRHRHTGESFEAWVFAIARNVAVDHHRTNRNVVSIDTIYDLKSTQNVEAEVQQRGDLAALYAQLATLSEQEQELIALKYGAGMTNRAIAEVTGLSASNVGTVLYRTIRKLRAELKEVLS